MIIKVQTLIAIEVEDAEQAERACESIDGALAGIMSPFPQGEVVDVDVSGYTVATEEEINEKGWSE